MDACGVSLAPTLSTARPLVDSPRQHAGLATAPPSAGARLRRQGASAPRRASARHIPCSAPNRRGSSRRPIRPWERRSDLARVPRVGVDGQAAPLPASTRGGSPPAAASWCSSRGWRPPGLARGHNRHSDHAGGALPSERSHHAEGALSAGVLAIMARATGRDVTEARSTPPVAPTDTASSGFCDRRRRSVNRIGSRGGGAPST